jgi:hypothetical protein
MRSLHRHSHEGTPPRRIVSQSENTGHSLRTGPWIPARATLGRNDDRETAGLRFGNRHSPIANEFTPPSSHFREKPARGAA